MNLTVFWHPPLPRLIGTLRKICFLWRIFENLGFKLNLIAEIDINDTKVKNIEVDSSGGVEIH